MRLDDRDLAAYLARAGLLPPGQGECRVEIPGPGNINYVRRVRPPAGPSLILKQARGELERFPEYRVSADRLLFEQRFLACARERVPQADAVLPRVLHFDPALRVLVLEDLGDGPDLREALAQGLDLAGPLESLGRFLGDLHARTAGDAAALEPSFANREMQELHGEHIFTHPYAPNDFPVHPEIRAAGERTLATPGLRDAIATLRRSYYETRRCLVHGDVQSGNLLLRDGRLRLLDAEIAHIGDPAFDLGCALAQLQYPLARRPDDPMLLHCARMLVRGYQKGGRRTGDTERAQAYAGVEMLRRILGAAREPLMADPDSARAGLSLATRLILERAA